MRYGLVPYGRPSWGLAVPPSTAMALAQSSTDATNQAAVMLKDPTAADVAKIAGAAGGAALASTTAAPIVMALITSAGMSASVPVVGWITAGVLATVAGTIALVGALRKGKVRKQQAVAMALELGIPEAANVPAFTVKAFRLARENPQKLYKKGIKIERRLRDKRSGGFKLKPALWFRSDRKLASKLSLIGTILAFQQAEARGAMGPSPPERKLEGTYGGSTTPVWVWYAAGGMLGLALLVTIMKRRR